MYPLDDCIGILAACISLIISCSDTGEDVSRMIFFLVMRTLSITYLLLVPVERHVRIGIYTFLVFTFGYLSGTAPLSGIVSLLCSYLIYQFLYTNFIHK